MHFVWRLAILLMVGLAPSASFAREPLPRSVLYLDENDPGLPFAQGISAAFRAALNARSAERIAVYAENLDLVRSSGPRYEEILKTYLREKYRDRPIGVITTIGPAALTFMLRARPELWPDVPAIFASVDPETAAQVQIPVGVTGLVRRQTVRDSVSVARALMPNLKRIALVGDRLERQNFRRHFEEEIPLLAAEVEIIDLTGLPMVELRKRVATLPEDTVIYFTTLTFDGDRPAYISRDALVSIAEVANRPIVVDLEPNVGYGGVGGLVADPDRIGSEAARLVLRILNGESAADIPVLAGNFVRPVFDWGELRRWNVSEHRLPAGSDVLFRQPGLWEQYKWYILAAAALVVIEAAFIVALLANRRRLQASEDRISLAADAADLYCWEWEIPSDQVWTTGTGRNALDWRPSRPLTFEQVMERVHPDDRESMRQALQRSVEGGGDYEVDYRLVAPGVDTRWLAARGRCEFDRDGKPLRMRGVTIDITKRRQAEEALIASEQRVSLAADAASLRCWEYDIQSDQLWATQTDRNMLGWWPSRPLTFEQFTERVHPDDRESVRRAVQRSREDRSDYEAEYRLVVPGGGTRWVAARGRREFDRDGKPLRMRGVTIDITKRRQAEEAARELSGRLINAQEEERSRLARELHDDVTQRLALLAIDAGRGERNLPSAAGGTAMRAMRESLIRLSEDVHALAYRLHPSILEDLGLIEALKTECERFGRVASIPVDLKAQEVPDPLPHAVALCLYRIAQEALRNVGRHARASAVQVSLRRLDGGVQLAVRDNGAGFDPAQQRDRPSLGHASMRQRIYQLNGELEVESAPGHGTTVLAWVPLKEEQSEPSARAAG